MPTVLVSSKRDNSSALGEADASKIEGICKRLDGIESFQTSATAPETHKRCVSVILRNITAKKQGELLIHSFSNYLPCACLLILPLDRGSVISLLLISKRPDRR